MESLATRPASRAHEPVPGVARATTDTLPDPLSSFVGREDELRGIVRAIEGTRLLSLTGAGGSGKTRLAIEAARRSHGHFADGVCWVELAPVADPALLAAVVLSALGERAHAASPVAAQLAEAITDRELLVVLDNCEHLVAECARLAADMLRAAPRVRVLATSRESLGVPGERVWPVPTLGPDVAARLFEERARAVSPSFARDGANAAAIDEICRRLDGLPLAIELAAARVASLTPREIAARLDDCFRLLGASRRTALAHQQTLRATIDWSWTLLSAPEQEVLARLSVFAGGCTPDAAEAVCAGADLAGEDVIALLGALVDKSLVLAETQGERTRYRLLETVRQYATARLEESGRADDARRAHAEHVARLAEMVQAERFRGTRDRTVAPLAAELDNLRAALRWSRTHDAALYVRIAFGYGWCYFTFGLWREGREWIEQALLLPEGRARQAPRARALVDLGYTANYQLDVARARPALEEALSIWKELGDPVEYAHAQQMLAQVHLFEFTPESLEAALRIAEEAERTLRAHGEWMLVSWVSATLGAAHVARGDLARAIAAYEESRRVSREVGHSMSVAIACTGMASIALRGADLARSAGLLREALAAHREAPDFMFLAWTIECTAIHAAVAGRLEDATRLLGAGQTVRRHAGAVVSIETMQPEAHARITAAARQLLGAERREAALDEGRRLDMAGTLALAEAVLAVTPEGGAPPAAMPAAGTVGPALRVISLGPVRVERRGTPVPLAEWKYAKARELLFLLLVHPGGRTREQIGLALWPEASAEQLRANLHPVLHHLRRVLGDPGWVVHENGVYRFDRARDHELDADALERLAASVPAVRGDADAAASLARLLALYGGDFLEQDPPAGDWHIERQDALRRLFEDALAALAGACMTHGRWREAAEGWRRLVAMSDLDERAHRELMRCHERLGERREGVRVYERLAAVLRRELDTEPDRETRAVLERLQGGVPA